MGYSCPVCEDPQADGEHLANHLAITAMIRGGDHETWLDEHVPNWQELGEEELATELTDGATETEYPQVFEDTTTGGHEHSHDHSHVDPAGTGETQQAGMNETAQDPIPFDTEMPDSSDEETEDIMQEARELTQKRRANASNPEEGSANGPEDETAESADDAETDNAETE